MNRPIDLPRARRALAELDRIAAEHPELCRGGERWADNIDALERAMGTPAKIRTAAYKGRLREKGYKQISVFLSPQAQERLAKLAENAPDKSIGDIISDVLAEKAEPLINVYANLADL